jgi:hypothetical protein
MGREADSPHIIRGDHCHRVELISIRTSAYIRAGNDSPGSIDDSRWAGSRRNKWCWR